MQENLHIVSVLVQDGPGVVGRISGLFARRAFSFKSIITGETTDPNVVRITITVEADDRAIDQIVKQLNKLIMVLRVQRNSPENTVARSLMMLKVKTDNATRPQVVDAANLFRANIVDVAPDSVIIEATGKPDKLAALVEIMRDFGILEQFISGPVALGRGCKALLPPSS